MFCLGRRRETADMIYRGITGVTATHSDPYTLCASTTHPSFTFGGQTITHEIKRPLKATVAAATTPTATATAAAYYLLSSRMSSTPFSAGKRGHFLPPTSARPSQNSTRTPPDIWIDRVLHLLFGACGRPWGYLRSFFEQPWIVSIPMPAGAN